MQPTEAVTLCRLAKAFCPQQQFDEFTADAWGEALEPYRFEDAKQALVEHTRESPFISPAEVIDGVKRIRRDRINAFGELPDPPSSLDPENARAYNAWKVQITKDIADGVVTEPPPKPEIAGNPEAFKALRELRAKADRNAREGLDMGEPA